MTTICRMYYRERAKPENVGEARPVASPSEAQQICERHNLLYRRYKHFYEREELHPEKNGHGQDH